LEQGKKGVLGFWENSQALSWLGLAFCFLKKRKHWHTRFGFAFFGLWTHVGVDLQPGVICIPERDWIFGVWRLGTEKMADLAIHSSSIEYLKPSLYFTIHSEFYYCDHLPRTTVTDRPFDIFEVEMLVLFMSFVTTTSLSMYYCDFGHVTALYSTRLDS